VGARNQVLDDHVVHTGTTWRMRLDDTNEAAFRAIAIISVARVTFCEQLRCMRNIMCTTGSDDDCQRNRAVQLLVFVPSSTSINLY